MAKKRDEQLYKRLRSLGIGKGPANKVSKSMLNSSKAAPKAARRALGDFTAAAAEVKDRIDKGPQKRKAAAKKAARTRARKAEKRSEAAKKAAKTRAKAAA